MKLIQETRNVKLNIISIENKGNCNKKRNM